MDELPPGLQEGLADAQTYRLQGDRGRTRAYSDSAVAAFDELVRGAPSDAQGHVFRGLALAYLGRKAEAVAEGEKAVALQPIRPTPTSDLTSSIRSSASTSSRCSESPTTCRRRGSGSIPRSIRCGRTHGFRGWREGTDMAKVRRHGGISARVILGKAEEACVKMASFASLRMTRVWAAAAIAVLPATGARLPPSVPASVATLDEEGVAEVIAKFKEKDPGLADVFARAAGYAVYPTIGKGGIGIGGARGKGWVYEGRHVIGRSTMNQVTIGLQFGGQVYSEVVFFKTTAALDNFKLGHLKLDAQASAIALTARASADLAYRNGVAIVTMAKGGLMYEASVGGQKFSFHPVGK